ncbi:hypothetical protein TNCT_428911 [Trichonephila clavata]|uniref:Uncharacterized protein n=1 Tax=Trichonephila clavata TaxID=2740835 RepID=A0A8X6KQL6_TRICU|nr:hypothetical protein TNCT_428911 [Trichonephila clavata]
MFFEGTPHDYDVIKINQAGLVRKSSKDSKVSVSRSNVAGILHKPKGITLNCQSPCPVVKSETGCSSPYVPCGKTTSAPNSTQRAFKTHFVVLGTLPTV